MDQFINTHINQCGGNCCYLNFIDEETETWRSFNLAKATAHENGNQGLNRDNLTNVKTKNIQKILEKMAAHLFRVMLEHYRATPEFSLVSRGLVYPND